MNENFLLNSDDPRSVESKSVTKGLGMLKERKATLENRNRGSAFNTYVKSITIHS
ncbi:hypothetical protein EMIT07CA2_60015 [Brevibacillus sp. IT-7CA2]